MRANDSASAGGWLMRSLSRWSRQAGFSLAETTIILAATSVLTATAAPSIMDYVAQARSIKASGDIQVLVSAVSRLMFDVGRLSAAGAESPEMLVGPGEAVEAASPDTQPWTAGPDGGRVQNLEDHLVTNTVGYKSRGAAGFSKGWGGPYVDKVPVDPWGHRYEVNIGSSGGVMLMLSAGPDGRVETPFSAPGLRVGGDDVVGLLGSRR